MDLIEKAAIGDDTDSTTLMNLVMQFRKVCNHPDLFERAETRSPFSIALSLRPRLSFARATTLKWAIPLGISLNWRCHACSVIVAALIFPVPATNGLASAEDTCYI